MRLEGEVKRGCRFRPQPGEPGLEAGVQLSPGGAPPRLKGGSQQAVGGARGKGGDGQAGDLQDCPQAVAGAVGVLSPQAHPALAPG